MSKTGRATYIQKRTAKNLYEQDGESFTAIGRELGFGGPTVSSWAKEEGWIKAGTVDPYEKTIHSARGIDDSADDTVDPYEKTIHSARGIEDNIGISNPVADAIEAYIPQREDTTDNPTSLQDLRVEVALLEARNAELDAEVERLKPTVDISAYVTDRVQWLEDNSPEGDQFWTNRAERKFSKDNMKRAKDGLVPFNIKEHPDMLEDLIVELKTTERSRQQGEPEEPASRKVKMLIVRNGQPTIEQIPLENQINNMKGSLADGIVRYTRKGFKLTDPFLCPRAGCYKPAGTDDAGQWLHDGYCKDSHRQEVEGDQVSVTAGLNVRDVMSSV